MNPDTLMHGIDHHPDDDLSRYDGWLIQKKFRGVRLYWDGQRAWTRQGLPVALPDDWEMPSTPLDCELYDGIDGERRCVSAVKWNKWSDTMRLIAFDLPAHGGSAAARLGALYLQPLSFASLLSGSIPDLLAGVLARGGEGLMLRHPAALYTPGRSPYLVKLKQ